MGRSHGGDPAEPNCKPNYLSVMSYLFQLHGLLDDNGVPHLDFSGQTGSPLDETLLSDGAISLPYRTAWYAPVGPGTLGGALGLAPAKKFCSGQLFPNSLPANWTPMARVDGPAAADPSTGTPTACSAA